MSVGSGLSFNYLFVRVEGLNIFWFGLSVIPGEVCDGWSEIPSVVPRNP